jgi:NAD(P)-dependent dehydrogenase (short-subunit alcohol dehydrogenase family)
MLSIHTLESLPEQEWARVVDVCQRGTWLGIRAVLASMRLEGGGAVVNITSVYGRVGSRAAMAYHMAKGAVRALTKAAAVELADQGIRVNAVCPGLVETPMTAALPEQFVADFVAATPMGRLGTTEDIAQAVLFLASDDAAFVTGAELVVDGGFTAQ